MFLYETKIVYYHWCEDISQFKNGKLFNNYIIIFCVKYIQFQISGIMLNDNHDKWFVKKLKVKVTQCKRSMMQVKYDVSEFYFLLNIGLIKM